VLQREDNYGPDTVFIMAYVNIPESTPVGKVYGVVAIGFVIDSRTDIVVDSSITFLTAESKAFFTEMTRGFNMSRDIEELNDIIKRRFIVASQRAVCVAVREVDKKYKKWKLGIALGNVETHM